METFNNQVESIMMNLPPNLSMALTASGKDVLNKLGEGSKIAEHKRRRSRKKSRGKKSKGRKSRRRKSKGKKGKSGKRKSGKRRRRRSKKSKAAEEAV